jgi:hypothetical protein
VRTDRDLSLELQVLVIIRTRQSKELGESFITVQNTEFGVNRVSHILQILLVDFIPILGDVVQGYLICFVGFLLTRAI